MKKILFFVFVCYFAFTANAQIADGSVAPDFTATDIDGNTHSLQSYLNAGKTVILNISATWCGPCWNYKQTGALSDIHYAYGPDGSDEVVLLYVEGDASTGLAELNGSGNTVGDWVSTTPFPIIDNATIASDYQITYFPTVYRICPDGYVYEMGQLSNNDIVNHINTNCSGTLQGVSNHGRLKVSEVSLCEDGVTADFDVNVINYGNNTLNSVDFDVVSGSNVTSVSQSTSLNMFQEETFTVNAYLDSSVDNSLDITYINGGNPNASSLNSTDIIVSAAGSTDVVDVEVRVYTDNYPAEITWDIKDEQGNVVASGGPYQPGNDDQYGAGGPDALTTKVHDVTLPDAEQCFSITIYDSFGDGWSLTDGSIDPGIEVFSEGSSIFSTGIVGNFGDSQSFTNAFNYEETFGNDTFDQYGFDMYPNPTYGKVNVSANESFKLEIYNLNGKKVFQQEIDNSLQVDLSSLSSGVYLTKVTIGSSSKTTKLIIK